MVGIGQNEGSQRILELRKREVGMAPREEQERNSAQTSPSVTRVFWRVRKERQGVTSWGKERERVEV